MRPALLLAVEGYTPATPNALPFAKITTKKKEALKKWTLDLIKDEDPEFALTGLTETCYIRFVKPQEIEPSGILTYRGELGPDSIELAKYILQQPNT